MQTFYFLKSYVPELRPLVFTWFHGNRFCESTFQLIFQCTPRCTNWSRLTYFDFAWQQKAAGQAVRHRGRLMLDNTGVSLLIYIVLFSQSSERLVFCERNKIPRTETSHCSHSQTPCVPQSTLYMYWSTPLQPLNASAPQYFWKVKNLREPQFCLWDV